MLTYVCVPYGGGSADRLPAAGRRAAGRARAAGRWPSPATTSASTRTALPFDELTAPGRRGDPGAGRGPARAVRALRRRQRDRRRGGPHGWRRAGRELDGRLHRRDVPVRPARRALFAALRTRLEQLRSNRHYANWLKSHGRRHRRARPGAGRPDHQQHAGRLASVRGVLHRPARPAGGEAARPDHLGGRLERTRSPTTTPSGTASGSSSATPSAWWCWTRPGTSSSSTGPTSWPRSSPHVHPALADGRPDRAGRREARGAGRRPGWLRRLRSASTPAPTPAPGRWSQPSMAPVPARSPLGQLVSITGSALTAFAAADLALTRTGSVANFGLLWALALICGVLDRAGGRRDRRPDQPAADHDDRQLRRRRHPAGPRPRCSGPATWRSGTSTPWWR